MSKNKADDELVILAREKNEDALEILLDRYKDFDTYKKIFEYKKIPLQIYKDESFNQDDDSVIFKNLLKFIIIL